MKKLVRLSIATIGGAFGCWSGYALGLNSSLNMPAVALYGVIAFCCFVIAAVIQVHFDNAPCANVFKNPDSDELVVNNTDLFFADVGNKDTARAKHICRECPHKEPCGDYAIDNNIEFGVWGGMGPKERNRLRVRRAAKLAT